MNQKDKSLYQEALKEYDNKDYKKCKKSCDKILSKSPSNQEALALKGLAELGLGDKVVSEKLLKESIKINMKNDKVWQFYGLFHRECKNYNQAVKCFTFSLKYEEKKDNTTVLRDLSNLLLYLGRFEEYQKYSRELTLRMSSSGSSWAQFCISEYFLKRYQVALKLVEILLENFKNTMKKQDLHEVLLFKSKILYKLNQHKECITFLEENLNNSTDRITFYELIVKNCLKIDEVETGVKYSKLSLKINPENIFSYLNYFNLKIKGLNLNKYEDLFKLEENSEQRKNIYEILTKEIEPELNKVKITEKIKLGILSGDEFKKSFLNYFFKNIKNNLPSFFNNIKFIYQYEQQKSKIQIIQDILTSNITEIETKNSLTNDILSLNKDNSNMNIPPVFLWIYYFASQHYLFLGELEKALGYINKAIKSTPSVVEFYMVKSKILKHNLLFEEAQLAMKKAKELDLGDRYLNAKHSKTLIRMGDVDMSSKTMMEFVKNPLHEENMLRYQCLWYKVETGLAYLKNNKLLLAHRMFKGILDNFKEMYDDQNDFYNYSLRRYMLNAFYDLIMHMKTIYRNKNVITALFNMDLIRTGLQSKFKSNEKELRKQLDEEFLEAKLKGDVKIYNYTSYEDLIKSIDNDIYEFLTIIQSLTKCKKVHYLCIKQFLLKHKLIKALKSFLVLVKEDNTKNNFYAYKANKLMQNYLKENEANINKSVLEYVKKKMSEIDLKNVETLKIEGNVIEKIKFQLLNCDNMFDEKNENAVESMINEIKVEDIRKTQSKNINELLIFVSLYLGKEKMDKILEKLKEKVKMKIDNYEEEIKDNLTLYQTEEEAQKLFPNYRQNKTKEEKKEDEKDKDKDK